MSAAAFAGSEGYDGKFYHFMAHDPWLRRGFVAHVDNARMRWRRILLPALAHTLALAHDEWVDVAYVAAVLTFLCAGTLAAATLLARHGLPPLLGICFVLVPAVTSSLHAMTGDVALAALTVGFALGAVSPHGLGWNAMLVLAPLARETGFLLPTLLPPILRGVGLP